VLEVFVLGENLPHAQFVHNDHRAKVREGDISLSLNFNRSSCAVLKRAGEIGTDTTSPWLMLADKASIELFAWLNGSRWNSSVYVSSSTKSLVTITASAAIKRLKALCASACSFSRRSRSVSQPQVSTNSAVVEVMVDVLRESAVADAAYKSPQRAPRPATLTLALGRNLDQEELREVQDFTYLCRRQFAALLQQFFTQNRTHGVNNTRQTSENKENASTTRL
jgi:hypothetical protein